MAAACTSELNSSPRSGGPRASSRTASSSGSGQQPGRRAPPPHCAVRWQLGSRDGASADCPDAGSPAAAALHGLEGSRSLQGSWSDTGRWAPRGHRVRRGRCRNRPLHLEASGRARTSLETCDPRSLPATRMVLRLVAPPEDISEFAPGSWADLVPTGARGPEAALDEGAPAVTPRSEAKGCAVCPRTPSPVEACRRRGCQQPCLRASQL